MPSEWQKKVFLGQIKTTTPCPLCRVASLTVISQVEHIESYDGNWSYDVPLSVDDCKTAISCHESPFYVPRGKGKIFICRDCKSAIDKLRQEVNKMSNNLVRKLLRPLADRYLKTPNANQCKIFTRQDLLFHKMKRKFKGSVIYECLPQFIQRLETTPLSADLPASITCAQSGHKQMKKFWKRAEAKWDAERYDVKDRC